MKDGQNTPCFEADFYPYGGERDITITCTQNYKFEGKERDPETQNDDFGARYYSNRFGRWLSADWSSDPEPVPYANLSNPQTLNLYAMVSDNPETFADLDGHTAASPTALPEQSMGCASDLHAQDCHAGHEDPQIQDTQSQQQQQALTAQPQAAQKPKAQALAAQVPSDVKSAIAASVRRQPSLQRSSTSSRIPAYARSKTQSSNSACRLTLR